MGDAHAHTYLYSAKTPYSSTGIYVPVSNKAYEAGTLDQEPGIARSEVAATTYIVLVGKV